MIRQWYICGRVKSNNGIYQLVVSPGYTAMEYNGMSGFPRPFRTFDEALAEANFLKERYNLSAEVEVFIPSRRMSVKTYLAENGEQGRKDAVNEAAPSDCRCSGGAHQATAPADKR